MGIKDFLKKSSGLDLVAGDESNEERASVSAVKESKRGRSERSETINRGDVKMLKQLEMDLSRAIEKLEDARNKLRVRRGY